MIIQKLKEKRGGAFLTFLLIILLLFPLIITSYVDVSTIYRISKLMKRSLNCATKSAASRIDWEQVPTTGVFSIDPAAANQAFQEIMNLNLGIAAIPVGSYYEYTDSKGRVWRYYMTLTNVQHPGTYEDFPALGTIPAALTNKPLQVKVDRPTVFAIATCDYRVFNALGGRTVRITQIAAAQLSYHSLK